jgi:hypothetical protein
VDPKSNNVRLRDEASTEASFAVHATPDRIDDPSRFKEPLETSPRFEGIRVYSAKDALSGLQRATIQKLGTHKVALIRKQDTEVVHIGQRRRMLRAEDALTCLERSAVHRLSTHKVTLVL